MIGEVIKQKREALGLSQAELANKIGKSKSSLCKIEKGVNDVNTKNLADIAKALECNIVDLVKEI